MIDVWLKITGTKKQARDALRTLGLDREMLRRDAAGKLQIVGYNHHVAINFIPNLITKFGTYDLDGNEVTPPTFAGPHLMIRFLSARAMQKAREKIVNAGGLPPGLQRVPAPATIKWFGD